MADNLGLRGSPDNDLINLNQSHEVRYWCTALNCTLPELQAAVRAVGNSAKKVKTYLQQQKLAKALRAKF